MMPGFCRESSPHANRGASEMRFFDCNCFVGRPMIAMLKPAPTADDLLAEMDRAGIQKALVWHVVQRDCAVPTGNGALRSRPKNSHGCGRQVRQ